MYVCVCLCDCECTCVGIRFMLECIQKYAHVQSQLEPLSIPVTRWLKAGKAYETCYTEWKFIYTQTFSATREGVFPLKNGAIFWLSRIERISRAKKKKKKQFVEATMI